MSGTQSPPLEFTGEEKTLGAPATNKPEGAANVKADVEQRAGEFGVHGVSRTCSITWDIRSQVAIELMMYACVAYFGGKTEETKQSCGGSDISKVGYVFNYFVLDVTYRRLTTYVFQAMKTADDSVKRTDAKYQEAKELGY